MAKRQIIQICGKGYSGSSITNMLFDSVTGVRALGEFNGKAKNDVFPYQPDIPCYAGCERCDFFDGVHESKTPYGEMFDRYPDAKVLVDSTKLWRVLEKFSKAEPYYDYIRVRIVKLPHAWLHSSMTHNGWGWDDQPRMESLINNWFGVHLTQVPTLTTILYRDFIAQPDFWLAHCMGLLGWPRIYRREHWWQTSSHIISGNLALRNQQTNPEFFDTADAGKYQGLKHTLFVDRAWREDKEFIKAVSRLYAKNWDDYEKRLKGVGLFNMDMLVDDLVTDMKLSDRLPAVQGEPVFNG